MGYHTPCMRQIDRGSRVPPWEQVANHLRAEIAAGKYDPEGPPLPSVRRLSEEWDVARRTANRALRELADEGLIEVVDGLGYFAARR
jgi:GntR family transcriptional regulator, histidine utilization repressor